MLPKSWGYGWLVVLYFSVGGLASAAQFIATALDVLGTEADLVPRAVVAIRDGLIEQLRRNDTAVAER